MKYLRSNTAVIVAVGPFFDRTDGVTIETALTITNERITLTADTDDGAAPTIILDNIAGATSGTANDLDYITGGDNGKMQLELAAANVNRVGRMSLSITDAANHVPVFEDFFVLPQALYDWVTGVIVPLPANVTTWLGTAAATPTVAGVPEVDLTHVSGATTNVAALATNVDAILTDTADMQPKLGTPAGASISADLLAIDNFVDGLETTIGVAGAGLTDLGGMSTTMKAQVQTEADDALVANHLDHLLAVDYDPAAKPGTATALLNELVESDAGVSRYTANALELAPTGGSAPTVGQIADEVQTRTIAGVTLVATTTTLTNAPVDSSGVTTLLSRLSALRAGYLDNLSAGAAALEASVQSVLSKVLKYVQLIVRKDSAIATDNATELTAINASGGSGAGAYVSTTDALEAIRDKATDIETDTAEIGAAGAGLTTRASQTSVDDLPTNAELATSQAAADDATLAAIAALNNLSAAQVNAEADTALADAGVTSARQTKLDSLTFTGANRVDANVAAVNNSTTGVDKLSAHLPAVLKVILAAGSTTTEVVLDATTGIDGGVPSAVNDFYNGRVIVFTSGALAGQATDITDYVAATKTLTVTALTGSPAAAVTGVIV